MTVAIVILVIIGILMILGIREKVPASKGKGLLSGFYKAAAFIKRRLIKRPNKYYRSICNSIDMLEPSSNIQDKADEYLTDKLGLCLILLTAGCILSIALKFKGEDTSLTDGYKLPRNKPGEGSYSEMLHFSVDGKDYGDMEIVVNEEMYTEKEFLELMPEYTERLLKKAIGRNESWDLVNADLELADSLEGYPFVVEWETEDREIVDKHGKIWQGKEADEEGRIVNLTARIKYEEYVYDYIFPVKVYPEVKTPAEAVRDYIEESIQKSQEESAAKEYMVLPDDAEGAGIIWSSEKSNLPVIVLVVFGVAAAAVFIGRDRDIGRKKEERLKQMRDDYPEIVSKLTLLIGAGMTVRSAFTRISADYRKNSRDRRYVYEEIVLMVHEMETGVTEIMCYQHFAKRINLQKYSKMVSLLSQNLKMGSRGLVEDLRRESEEALAEKQNSASRLGEEAGTKLMLPMFMQLIIVMVVIMIPAFMSM